MSAAKKNDAGSQAVESVDQVHRVDDADHPEDRHGEGEDPHLEWPDEGQGDSIDAKATQERDCPCANLRDQLVQGADASEVIVGAHHGHAQASDQDPSDTRFVLLNRTSHGAVDEEESYDRGNDREEDANPTESWCARGVNTPSAGGINRA